MIISCTNCQKKFDVKDNLIPKSGRLLECSSCKHKWFFKNDVLVLKKTTKEKIAYKDQIKEFSEDEIFTYHYSQMTGYDENGVRIPN